MDVGFEPTGVALNAYQRQLMPQLAGVVLALYKMATNYSIILANQLSNSSPESWHPDHDVL